MMCKKNIIISMTIFFLCWVFVSSGRSARPVDCEKYVFHPQCRGSQARKRVIGIIDNNNSQLCTCKSTSNNNSQNQKDSSQFNAKLLEAMLSNGLDLSTLYEAYTIALSSMKNNNNNNLKENSNKRPFASPSHHDAFFITDSDIDADY